MPTPRAKERVAQVAERQFGRITRAQFQEIAVPSATIAVWLTDGYLHRILPHVYAVGHRAASTESDLAAALLYAGPGAALSHGTAAWWLGLIDERPRTIHVSTPRRCRSHRRPLHPPPRPGQRRIPPPPRPPGDRPDPHPRPPRRDQAPSRRLIGICERYDLPLPEIDAFWPEHKLAVELDGYGNHHTPAQLRRYRRKEMALRRLGLTVN